MRQCVGYWRVITLSNAARISASRCLRCSDSIRFPSAAGVMPSARSNSAAGLPGIARLAEDRMQSLLR